MNRRFAARVPKKYTWDMANAVGQFSDATVLAVDMVTGANFQQGQAVVVTQSRVANVIRIVGDITMNVNPTELNDVADNFIYGPAYWGILVVDEDDNTVYAPDSSVIFDERVLAWGLTPPIGLLLDTSAFAGGTGLGVSQGHQVPCGVTWHVDIHSNRRLSADDILRFVITRPPEAEITLQGGALYSCALALRTLLKLP